MEPKQKRPPGRPTKDPEQAKRAHLKIRIHERTRAALEDAAAENGWSVSEEVEQRLVTSVRHRETFDDALDLAHGHQTAALVMLFAGMMTRTAVDAVTAVSKAGGRNTAQTHAARYEWLSYPYAVDQAAAAVAKVFAVLKEVAEAEVAKNPAVSPPTFDANEIENRDLGTSHALGSLLLLSDVQNSKHLRWAEPIRERLGVELLQHILEVMERENIQLQPERG